MRVNSSRCYTDETEKIGVKNLVLIHWHIRSNTLRALLRKLTLESKLHARRGLLRVGRKRRVAWRRSGVGERRSPAGNTKSTAARRI